MPYTHTRARMHKPVCEHERVKVLRNQGVLTEKLWQIGQV
jgi:hypothetical protein